MWNVTYKTGTDNFGSPIHTTQYKHLFSNGPFENAEFPDYRFADHFKEGVSSFPSGEKIYSYLKGRYSYPELQTKINLNTNVNRVKYDRDKRLFRVSTQAYNEEMNALSEIRHSHFDKVIVANGHFCYPNNINIPGAENFTGRILHSGSFRNPEEFRNQRVLIIGSSYSAEDIGVQCYKYGCEHVYLSYRDNLTESFKIFNVLTLSRSAKSFSFL